VFLGCLYFISAARAQTKVAKVLAICVTLLAALRWFEAVALGKVAAWSSTLFQTQNNYALLFTAFSPFLLVFVVSARPLYRAAAALALVMVWGAAAINGSRGSWVAMAAGICLFLVLFTVAKPKRSWGLWGAVAVIVVVLASILLSSPRAANAISSRFSTFSSLDADKSFQARQYLNRRSWVLFRDSPVFGVGLGLYNQVAAPVEVPEWYKGHEDQFDRKSSHNSYLSFLAETGLVGALPFCDMLVVLLVPGMLATVRLAKRGHMWALGAFVGLFSMAIHMWVISALTNTATWFVYGFAGTVIIAAREERRLRALVGRKQGTFGGSGSGRTNSQRSPAL
jgi:O-antigen ligase